MVIPENYAQVNLRFTGTALPRRAEVTFGVHDDVGITPLTIAGYVASRWNSAVVQAFFSSQSSLTSIYVKKGPTETGPSAELATALPGLSSATSVTPNVSVLVRKNTPFGGRQGRGRFYLPCWVEGSVDSAGALDSSLRTNLQTNLNTFRTSMESIGLPLVLLHNDALVPYPITELVVDGRVATQRRRLRK